MIDRKVAATLLLVAVAGIGLTAATYYGSQQAQAQVTVDVQDGPISVTAESPSGQVSALNVEIDGTVSWSGFSDGVAEIGLHGGGDSVVYSPDGDLANATSGTFELSESDQGAFNPRIDVSNIDEKLSVDEDGATKTRTVTVTFEGYVMGREASLDLDKPVTDVPFSVSREIEVTVTNLPETDSGTGDDGNGDGNSNASVTTDFEWNASLEMANG